MFKSYTFWIGAALGCMTTAITADITADIAIEASVMSVWAVTCVQVMVAAWVSESAETDENQ